MAISTVEWKGVMVRATNTGNVLVPGPSFEEDDAREMVLKERNANRRQFRKCDVNIQDADMQL